MRPALLLMAARLCGYQGDRAIVYAAVVEFIHTATLVHDDIIDGSELRRGPGSECLRPTEPDQSLRQSAARVPDIAATA